VLAVGLFQIGKEYRSSATRAGAVLLAVGAGLTILIPFLAPVITSPMLTAGAALAYLGLRRLTNTPATEKCGIPLAVTMAALLALIVVFANSVVEPKPWKLIIEKASLVKIGEIGDLTVSVREMGWYFVHIDKVVLVKNSTPVCEGGFNRTVEPGGSEYILIRCNAPIKQGETYYIVIKYRAWGPPGCRPSDIEYTEPFPVVAR